MRGNSQLLRSANSYVRELRTMKTPFILLFTNDNELKDLVAQALSEIGGVSHLARDVNEALETVRCAPSLDFAIVDFEHGSEGLTLLRAINALCRYLHSALIARSNVRPSEPCSKSTIAKSRLGAQRTVSKASLTSRAKWLTPPISESAWATRSFSSLSLVNRRINGVFMVRSSRTYELALRSNCELPRISCSCLRAWFYSSGELRFL